ncbi:MAG: hypothetical protein WCI45_05580 [Desulfuromonadales bacterium]
MNISNNPFECGHKLKTGFDYFAKGFNKNELVDAFYHLIADRRQGQLLLECAEFCDVDEMYNPGEEIDDEVDRLSTVEGIILEAVRVKAYARTAQTMAALQKVLNKHLSGTGKDITAGDAIIGKPKKNGLFASVTVQFPLTDGQTLSIIFHSPDNNKMKITAADEIIAFRWLLNKRDITSAVSPDAAEEGNLPGLPAAGKDVSLEEVGTRCAQLIAKNSDRFAAKSADLVAAKKLKEELNAQVSGLQDSNGQLQQNLAVKIHDGELSDAQINSTQRQLEKQISYNEELRAKLEGLKATGAGNDGKAGGEDTTGGVDKAAAVAALLEEKKAAFEGELIGRGFGPHDGLAASDRILKLITTTGAVLVVTFDKYARREGSVAMVKITKALNSSSSTEKTFFAKTEKSLDSLYAKALAFIDKKLGEIKKPAEVKFDPTTPEGYASIAGNAELEEKYQDGLDSLFTSRAIGARNALRDLGWIQNGEAFFKGNTGVTFDFKKVGAGGNVVGVTASIFDKETNMTNDQYIKDDLTQTPEEIAKALDAFVVAEVQPEPEVANVDPATVDDTLGADTNPDRDHAAEIDIALATLDDIISGKYTDSATIGDVLDAAAAKFEEFGVINLTEIDAKLNSAADYLTEILKKEAAGVM